MAKKRLFSVEEAFVLDSGVFLLSGPGIRLQGLREGDPIILRPPDRTKIDTTAIEIRPGLSEESRVSILCPRTDIGPRLIPTGAEVWAERDEARALRLSVDLALARSFGLERLGAGRHTIRREDHFPIGEIEVGSLWTARIMPSFHPHATLTIASISKETKASYVVLPEEKGEHVFPSPIVMREWQDPLRGALEPLLLVTCWDHSQQSLDGIGYRLDFHGSTLDGSLEFCNPFRPEIIRVVRVLLDVATEISRRQSDSASREHLEAWRPYLSVGPS